MPKARLPGWKALFNVDLAYYVVMIPISIVDDYLQTEIIYVLSLDLSYSICLAASTCLDVF